MKNMVAADVSPGQVVMVAVVAADVGRTGRAGRRGQAITLFTEADMPRLRSIANVVKLSGCEVPDWMLAIKPVSSLHK
jgi:ATP-dependent RNA helicase DDX52/ROK1